MSTKEAMKAEKCEEDAEKDWDWPKSPEVLVEEYGGLVKQIVQRLWERIDEPLSPADLQGYGFQGLLEAGERYDPEQGVMFITFAYPRIRGAVLDGLRRMRWDQRRIGCRVQDEICFRSDGRRRERRTAGRARIRRPGGVPKPVKSTSMLLVEPRSVENIRPSASPQVAEEEMMRRLEIDRTMAALERLSDMEREIVMRHCVGGESMSVIAEDLGCSKGWVCKLKDRATDQVREWMEACGLQEGAESSGELAEVETLEATEDFEKAA